MMSHTRIVFDIFLTYFKISFISVSHAVLCFSAAVSSFESQPTFRRNISPPCSGSKNKLKKLIYCTVSAVLVEELQTQPLIFHSFYLFPTSPSVLHHCRARTLEPSNRRLSNPRTVDSRTLVFVDWLFSSTLAYHLLIAS
jgi:hypothetical protein